jgi:hypothetical protein
MITTNLFPNIWGKIDLRKKYVDEDSRVELCS